MKHTYQIKYDKYNDYFTIVHKWLFFLFLAVSIKGLLYITLNLSYTIDLNHSIVGSIPSFKSIFGCHPNFSFAIDISGFLLTGSS